MRALFVLKLQAESDEEFEDYRTEINKLLSSLVDLEKDSFDLGVSVVCSVRVVQSVRDVYCALFCMCECVFVVARRGNFDFHQKN